MRASALQLLAVLALAVSAGCLGGPQSSGPATTPTATPTGATPTTQAQPTPTPTDQTRTSTASASTDPAISTLPGVDHCAGVGLPATNETDGLAPATYPSPPEPHNATTVASYVASFEAAYFRNAILAEAGTDPDMNLTHVSTHARPTRTIQHDDGYGVHLRVSAGTRYESGAHGDRWPSIGYFVNETVLIRGHVDGEADRVTAGSGTVVLRCATG